MCLGSADYVLGATGVDHAGRRWLSKTGEDGGSPRDQDLAGRC